MGLHELEQKLEGAFKTKTAAYIAESLRKPFEGASKRFEREQQAMRPSRKQLQQPINL